MEKTVFSTDCAGTIGYPYARKWNLTFTLHLIQKLTWNESQTEM